MSVKMFKFIKCGFSFNDSSFVGTKLRSRIRTIRQQLGTMHRQCIEICQFTRPTFC